MGRDFIRQFSEKSVKYRLAHFCLVSVVFARVAFSQQISPFFVSNFLNNEWICACCTIYSLYVCKYLTKKHITNILPYFLLEQEGIKTNIPLKSQAIKTSAHAYSLAR